MPHALAVVVSVLGWACAVVVFIVYAFFQGLVHDTPSELVIAAGVVFMVGSLALLIRRRYLFAILLGWAPAVLSVGSMYLYLMYVQSDGYRARSLAREIQFYEQTELSESLRRLAAQEEVYRTAHGAYALELDLLGVVANERVITTILSATSTGWSARVVTRTTPTRQCVMAIGTAPLPSTNERGVSGAASTEAVSVVDSLPIAIGPGGTMVCE